MNGKSSCEGMGNGEGDSDHKDMGSCEGMGDDEGKSSCSGEGSCGGASGCGGTSDNKDAKYQSEQMKEKSAI